MSSKFGVVRKNKSIFSPEPFSDLNLEDIKIMDNNIFASLITCLSRLFSFFHAFYSPFKLEETIINH